MEKKYICEYCKKNLSSRQSKWRHVNTCGEKKSLNNRISILEKKICDQDLSVLNKLVKNIKLTYEIVEKNYFNKTIISNEDRLNMIINNNIEIYMDLINELNMKIKPEDKHNMCYLNKIKLKKIKESKYEEYIKKLKLYDENLNVCEDSEENDNKVYYYLSD